MLRELRVKNLAVIESLTVPFGPGLNVLTGETGAGKSILIDALTLLLGTCAAAFGYVRWVQRGGEISLPKLPSLRKRPKLRVVPRPASRTEIDHTEEDESTTEVDALLDKIAKSGLASLSAAERAKLEKAREDLMKRESPRR